MKYHFQQKKDCAKVQGLKLDLRPKTIIVLNVVHTSKMTKEIAKKKSKSKTLKTERTMTGIQALNVRLQVYIRV